MAELFDVVPELFFSPLASPGKRVYWECICRLYAITSRQLSFGVERDVLVDDLEYYFDSTMAADLPEDDDSYEHTSRGKANFVLRKLESWGWIYTEVDHSYVQRVNFRDYSIQVIRTLLTVAEGTKVEYQGYIYTIYSLVRTSPNTNPGYGLLEIVKQTDGLITSLKNLNSNIKTYIDELTKHSTVSEILDALLNDYYTNIVDKAYHRLLTSDNVAKFRPEILSRLEKYAKSERYLKAASAEVAEQREIDAAQAREEVLTMLHQVVDAFRQMDDILDEINQKNTKYQRAAINRARFLLSSSDDLRGQLRTILTDLGERISEEKLSFRGVYELEELDHLIQVFSWEYLDTQSLYEPREGRKNFEPSQMPVRKVDEKRRAQRRLEMKKKLERVLDARKIDAYVDQVLGNRTQMKASEFPLEGDGFIRLIYVRLYGQRKNVHYRVDPLETVEAGEWRFRDFWVIRKQK